MKKPTDYLKKALKGFSRNQIHREVAISSFEKKRLEKVENDTLMDCYSFLEEPLPSSENYTAEPSNTQEMQLMVLGLEDCIE